MKNYTFYLLVFLLLLCTPNLLFAKSNFTATPPTTNGSFYCINDLTGFSPPLEANCTCTTGNTSITWWDAETGGNLLATGNTFNPVSAGQVANNLAGVYTFYARCECDDGSISSRSPAYFEVLDCNLNSCTNNSCNYFLILEDNGCNDWQGASIDVSFDGSTSNNYTLGNTDCIEVIPLNIVGGNPINLYYFNGANEIEHSYRLYDAQGNIAIDENGTAIDFDTSPPSFAHQIPTSCPSCCIANEDYTVRITTGTFPEEQSWEIHEGINNNGSQVFDINGTTYTGLAPGTQLTYAISLDKCQTYTFTAFDGFNDTWNGGTWELITADLNYGTTIANSNDPLVGNALLLDGPSAAFIDEENLTFTIPCQNEYDTTLNFVDNNSNNCMFLGDIVIQAPFVCSPYDDHALPTGCINEIITILLDGDPANVNTILGPFNYINKEALINMDNIPLGCHTFIHETTYCDGIVSKRTSNLNLFCTSNSDPNNNTILGYDLDCTNPEAMNPFNDYTETNVSDATLPFMVMDNGVGLQGNVFIPINLPQGATNEYINDLQINLDLTHNDYSDLAIVLHAPTAMGLAPITLANFGQVNPSNSFASTNGTNTALNNLIGIPTVQTTSTNPQNIIEETLGSASISDLGDTWYIQVIDNRSNAPNPAYGGGIINAASIALSSGFPNPELAFGCTAQSIILLSQTLQDTNCDQSEGNGAYIERVWEVTDMNGQVFTATQIINLKFPRLDEVDLPSDINLECMNQLPNEITPDLAGTPSFGGFDLTNQTTLLCDLSISYSDQVLNTCGNGFKIIRTWTILNWCAGTSIFHEQIIKYEDTAPPTITPSTITIGTNPYDCDGNLSVDDLTITDFCAGVASVTATYVDGGGVYNSNGNLLIVDLLNEEVEDLPFGLTEVLITAKDSCLNEATTLVTITVVDDTPPIAICNDQLFASIGSDGTAMLTINDIDEGSYDNCSDVTLEVRRTDGCLGASAWGTAIDFACCDANQLVTVELRATDDAGNTNICLKNTFVEDALPPIITCPNDLTLDCNDPQIANLFFGTPTATDNCQYSITLTDAGTLDQCQAGTLTRTWTASDGNSQSADASCTQMITVNHLSDFIVQFPADITITNQCPDDLMLTGQPSITNDDCEMIEITSEDFTYLNTVDAACYNVERTWTVVNWCIYDQGNPSNTNLGYPQPLPRTYLDDDGYFQYTQVIGVIDDIALTITCPNDMTIDCDDPATQNPIDTPTVTDGCQNITLSHVDTGELDQCQAGTLTRTWTANDACNPSALVSCTQEIEVVHVSDFVVQFPADITLSNQCPDDISLTGQPSISDDDCELIEISSEDLVLDIVQNACYKIERIWTVINWCIYDQGNPTNTDLGIPQPLPRTYQDDDGYFEYIQIIVIVDDIAPTITCPNDLTFCDLTDTCEGSINLTISATDDMCTSNPLEYSYKIDAFNDGIFDIIDNGDDASGIYPYGEHLIKWYAEDHCGNTSECTHLFTIEDCKNPTPVCLNGISVDILTCTDIPAADFLDFATDNCSSNSFVENSVKVRLEGDTNPPQSTIQFCPTDVGTNIVEIWVEDEAGNSNFCTTYAIIANDPCATDTEDPIAVCENSNTIEIVFGECATVIASDILDLATDNCSSASYLENSATIRLLGDSNPPQASMDFCAVDEGSNIVEIWVTDEAGNTTSCLAAIYIVYTPCIIDIVINNTTVANNGYYAEETVTSNGVVGPFGNVVFTAGDSICLNPGFEVIVGSIFHAYIQECPVSISEEEVEEK